MLAEDRVARRARRGRGGPRALLGRGARERLPLLRGADLQPHRPRAGRAYRSSPTTFVTTDDGTGIVHLAPAFGEDDYRVAAACAAGAVRPDAARRRSTTRCAATAPTTSACAIATEARSRGASSRTPRSPSELIEDLRERGLLLKVEDYEHSYPHCWRCGTPLLYYAKPSWYIATSRLRDELLAGQRHGRLAPAARQGRALRRLAAEQRRLGALARALLGHAAAGVALRERPRARDRLVRRARGALGRASSPTTTGRSSTRSRFPCPHGAGCRRADAARARGDRRVVRLGRDAVRPAPLPVRERGGRSRAASPPTSSARRRTRRAAGSTRCSPSRRCSAAARRTATSSASG